MQIDTPMRNARFTEDGRIDCEIKHPIWGWIPFTADPADIHEHGRAIFATLKNSAVPYAPPK